MAKRIFARVAVCLLSVAAVPAQAVAKSAESDGCAILADSIESAVARAVQSMPAVGYGLRLAGKRGANRVARPAFAARACATTTEATTAAFTSAFARLGVSIRWRDDITHPGDYCESYHLSECYPRTRGAFGFRSARTLAFVHDTWKAVRNSVSDFMPYGVASDWSSFNRDAMGESLRLSVLDHNDFPRDLHGSSSHRIH